MAVKLYVPDVEPVVMAIEDLDGVTLETDEVIRVVEKDYDDLINKPSINGVELSGNKTTADLGIEAGVRSINGQTGDVELDIPDDASDIAFEWGGQGGHQLNVNNVGEALYDLDQSLGDLVGDLAPVAFSGDFDDLTNVPTIPEKTSDLTNDSGFITEAPVTSVNNKTGAVALTASDVGALPSTTVIPSKTSDLTNDSGYITGYTETDPTVPAWAKASTKPTYTASEVGAYTKAQVDGLVSGVLHYKGTKATTAQLPTSGNVVGDTWHITADGSEWAWDGSVWQELGTAVDLSSYALKSEIPTVPSNVGAFTNDVGYLTSYTETDPTVPSWAKASSKPSYTASEVGALPSSTVIPSKTSDLTNDSNFISEAVMFVNLSKSGTTYTADKTYAEITTALNNGMMVYVIYNTYSYAYDGKSGTSYFFSCRIIETTKATQTDLTLETTGWSESTYELSATDSKLAITAAASGTTYYPILATNSTGAATRQYDRTGIAYKGTNGTTSATGEAALTLGNATASGTSGNKQGKLTIYGSTAYAHTLQGAPTAARTLTLPNASGTIALTSDIQTPQASNVQYANQDWSGYYNVQDVEGALDAVGDSLGLIENNYIPMSWVGDADGVCPLDENGMIDPQYLPVYTGGVS